MATIQIKNVPEDTHAVLVRRAAAAHQSLQAYLLSRLESDAGSESVDEILDRVESHDDASLPFDAALEMLEEGRDRR